MAGAKWGGPGQVNCYGVHAEGDSIVETKSADRAYHRSDSSFHSGTPVLEGGREQVRQFHKVLSDVIKRDKSPGLKKALALYEGYFGYYGER